MDIGEKDAWEKSPEIVYTERNPCMVSSALYGEGIELEVNRCARVGGGRDGRGRRRACRNRGRRSLISRRRLDSSGVFQTGAYYKDYIGDRASMNQANPLRDWAIHEQTIADASCDCRTNERKERTTVIRWRQMEESEHGRRRTWIEQAGSAGCKWTSAYVRRLRNKAARPCDCRRPGNDSNGRGFGRLLVHYACD